MDKQDELKQRHGCLTAWLVLMILANVISSYINLVGDKEILENYSGTTTLFGGIAIANTIFAILILQWKKIGFWGFLISSLLIFIINLYTGVQVISALFGLSGVALLYAILQIKKNEKSGWENLE